MVTGAGLTLYFRYRLFMGDEIDIPYIVGNLKTRAVNEEFDDRVIVTATEITRAPADPDEDRTKNSGIAIFRLNPLVHRHEDCREWEHKPQRIA